ncbi:hypothetical protein [Aquirhabdus parva]|uniref:PepSY domain-containing protein n=1 Tax=Aquirhabdus parva TaxID=2283318 RepID=A0A345P8J0_9GAMM|nr:hypothetical protein [Aquirhabdus parva]AXI03599.1 hypothetical protein HYN46_12625 [Aquirhabdus parva]
MNMSKHFTRLTFAAATLAMGISFPLYAADAPAAAPAAPAPAAAPAAAKPAHEAVKKVKHKAHKVAKEAIDEKGSAEKRVVWKNGVVFHDVEPTGQAAGTFGAPTSTSDTLKVDISQTAK